MQRQAVAHLAAASLPCHGITALVARAGPWNTRRTGLHPSRQGESAAGVATMPAAPASLAAKYQRCGGIVLEMASDERIGHVFEAGRLPTRRAILVDDGGAHALDEI